MAGLLGSILSTAASATLPAAVAEKIDRLSICPVSDPDDVVVRLLAQFDNEQIGLVQLMDKIEDALATLFLSRRMTIPNLRVAPDPENRGSEGVNPLEVTLLAADICEVGFSWVACKHATCIEEAPDSTRIEDFAIGLCSGCDELAPVVPGTIRFGSLSCTHTVMVLRAIQAKAASKHPHMSDGTNYSVDALAQRDPDFAKAVLNGLPWLVYSWKVRELYPRVPDLAQQAKNVGATLNRKESEMQTLLRLHKMSSVHTNPNEDVPWATIKKAIVRSRPPCQGKLGGMVSFVIGRSGGPDGEHLRFLSVFHRNYVASTHSGVPMSLYEALASFPHHYLALALLETAWTCHTRYVHNGECNFIGTTEVQSLRMALEMHPGSADASAEASHKRAVAAGKLLVNARYCAVTHFQSNCPKVWGNQTVKCFGLLDTGVIRYLLDKQLMTNFKSLSEIASVFCVSFRAAVSLPGLDIFADVLDIKEGLPLGGKTASAAKANAKAKAGAKSQAHTSTHLYKLDSRTGEMVSGIGRLRLKGFEVSSTVSLSQPLGASAAGCLWVVQQCSDEEVTLSGLDDSSVKETVAVPTFLEQAKVVSAADRLVPCPGWPTNRLMLSAAAAKNFAQARVWLALENAAKQPAPDLASAIDVFIKPSKSLRAKRNMAAGELVLWPEAAALKVLAGFHAEEEAKKATAVEVFLERSPLGFADRMFLCGSTTGESVAPYWFVEQAARSEDENMVAVMFSIQTMAGGDLVWDTASSLRAQILEASNIAESVKLEETLTRALATPVASGVVDLEVSPGMVDLLGPSSGSPASAATHIEKFEKATKESAQGAHRKAVLLRSTYEEVGRSQEYVVMLPAFVNSKAVKAGTKLCREKLTIASAPKAPAPITISSVMRKKARTE